MISLSKIKLVFIAIIIYVFGAFSGYFINVGSAQNTNDRDEEFSQKFREGTVKYTNDRKW